MSVPDHAAMAEDAAPIIDCWNRIGVYGDASCPLLREHVHCRNCPVYSAAAIQMLDRAQTGELQDAAMLAATREFATSKRGKQRAAKAAFVFRIGAEWLALSMTAVDEVADLRAIHSLPHRRNGVVLGVANVRGELVVCVSLAQLLGIDLAVKANSRQQRISHGRLLVMRGSGGRLAFPVDEAHGAERFDETQLQPVPSTVARSSARYSRAILH